MVRRKSSALIAAVSFGLIALAVMVLGTSSVSTVIAARKTKTPTPTPTQPTPTPTSADFLLNLETPPSFQVGFLPTDGSDGPLYASVAFGICAYTVNFLFVDSVNGFEGEVTLDVLNLPPGVTEDMADSVFVSPDRGFATPIVLRATTAAPLGDATVTLRGTSGTIVHTVDLPFHIVDQLPPPDCS